MPSAHLLIVSHHPQSLDPCLRPFTDAGKVVSYTTASDAVPDRLQPRPPAIILIDGLDPALPALEVCRRLKLAPHTAAIPLILLTALDREDDIVAGLELGVEAYLVRPYSARLLWAQAQALLQRRHAVTLETSESIVCGPLVLVPARYEVEVQGRPVLLKLTELRVLQLLMQHPGQVLSRQHIVQTVHGANANVTGRSVDVHIASLRRKFGGYARLIETVRGRGYRLRDSRSAAG